MFGNDIGQREIALVRSGRTPCFNIVTAVYKTSHLIVERTFTSATREIVPDRNPHYDLNLTCHMFTSAAGYAWS